MIGEQQARDIIGSTLMDSSGDKVGKVGQLFLDDQTGQPEWVAVNTGLFGTKESFVPLSDASFSGGELRVPYAKSQIKDAPQIDAGGHLDESDEDRLYAHYGLSSTAGRLDTGVTTGTAGMTDMDTNRHGTVGHDTSGPTTDNAMTRSEERLRAGTERVSAGKARLRKWVETENVQVDVPVTRERAVIEREPITEANMGNAMDGPAISEEEHEVTLTEERPIVTKETVPVERVRLDTQVETEVETVTEQVRKERIDADGDIVDLRGTTERSNNI